MRRLLKELKRRRVYRVGVAYLAAAFVVIELADMAAGAFGLPGWFEPMVWVLCGLGFPLALVLAWAFDVTPDGVERTRSSPEPEKEPDSEAEAAPASGSGSSPSPLAAKGLVALGILSAAAAGGWYLMGAGDGGGETEARLGDRSIAVLPFEALGQEQPGPFTEGMHDDLLARLSNVGELKVISRTAVQQYRDSEMTTGEISRELGVRWVLEGGVQRMGEQIQVNAQLIDPRSETHAWADSYRRDLTAEDLFDLQSDITRRIVASLETRLTREEERQVDRRPTEDLEAYRLYARGRSQLDRRTGPAIRSAIDFFQQAIRRDSTYALAWAGLADAVALHSVYGSGSVPASVPGQKEAALRALELAPGLAEAHASLGLLHINDRRGPPALRELTRAVQLKPSYAQAHIWLALIQLDLGRLDEAWEHVSLAVELDPRNGAARGIQVATLVARGEAARAAEHLDAVPPFRRPSHRAFVLYHSQRWEALERLTREQLGSEDRTGGLGVWHFYSARTALLRGDTAAARAQLGRIRARGDPLQSGLLRLALGETDEAFGAWEGVDMTRERAVLTFRYFYGDLLDPLRDDERYRTLIREANRAWGLDPDGSLPDSADISFEARDDG